MTPHGTSTMGERGPTPLASSTTTPPPHPTPALHLDPLAAELGLSSSSAKFSEASTSLWSG